ncbi:MAG: nickel insertion protein [Acetomicrobium sp.]
MLILVNTDNISGESVPYLIDGLMDRGASSVHAVPATTKKGRNEFLFFIDMPEACLKEISAFLALELDTLGLRIIEQKHLSFGPTSALTIRIYHKDFPERFFEVRVKELFDEFGETISCKAEYEDLKQAMHFFEDVTSISFKNMKSAVELAGMSREDIQIGEMIFCLLS